LKNKFVYPDFLQNMKISDFFQERRILAPTLDGVEHVNQFLLSLVPGDDKEYISSDSVCKSDENSEVHVDLIKRATKLLCSKKQN